MRYYSWPQNQSITLANYERFSRCPAWNDWWEEKRTLWPQKKKENAGYGHWSLGAKQGVTKTYAITSAEATCSVVSQAVCLTTELFTSLWTCSCRGSFFHPLIRITQNAESAYESHSVFLIDFPVSLNYFKNKAQGAFVSKPIKCLYD